MGMLLILAWLALYYLSYSTLFYGRFCREWYSFGGGDGCGFDKLVREQVDDNKKGPDDLGFVPGARLPDIPGSLVKRIKKW